FRQHEVRTRLLELPLAVAVTQGDARKLGRLRRRDTIQRILEDQGAAGPFTQETPEVVDPHLVTFWVRLAHPRVLGADDPSHTLAHAQVLETELDLGSQSTRDDRHGSDSRALANQLGGARKRAQPLPSASHVVRTLELDQ